MYAFGQTLKSAWKSLDVNSKLIWMMFKGSVPVAISLAIYQNTAVSEVYTSLGFLISIISVVTVNLFPRAKLVQEVFLICLFTAVAAGVSLLAMWSGHQARLHTDPEGLHKYNSSLSAVTAVWLFFNIWLSNSIQARYPALLLPTILYNIFMIVQFTSCSRFTTWQQNWDLVYLTMRCYYTGIAISFVSGLIIYPVTCRSEIFETQEKYIQSLRDMLKGTVAYLDKLRTTQKLQADSLHIEDEEQQDELEGISSGVEMKKCMTEVRALYTKMHQELAMAKREIAWGKLRAKDIGKITDQFRRILMPLSGMAKLPEILERIVAGGGWMACDFEAQTQESHEQSEASRGLSQDEYETIWKSSIGALIEPAIAVIEAISDGLEHFGLQLEIIPRPGTESRFGCIPGFVRNVQPDIEVKGESITPGSPEFIKLLEGKLEDFLARKDEALTVWASSKGLSPAQLEKVKAQSGEMDEELPDGIIRKDCQQLYLLLYVEHMLYTTGLAVLDLVKISNEIVDEGIMSKNRLILPSFHILKAWFLSVWDTTDAALADDDRPKSKVEARLLYGNSSRTTSNIEHLPPRNWFERFGIHIRGAQDFLKGPEFSFGFRSACATMSCAIVAYLHQTQEIFTHYRLIWSVIIAAIGGNMSAGQSGLSYILRICGSFLALICCYIVWYIVDGKVPGVIVMMWLCSFFQMYFLIRHPRYMIAWLVALVTEVLSIGYELQVKKIGIATATATGTYWFSPSYVAAMRVACVLWGTAASIFFTYLPYPITVKGLLRKDMAVIIQILAHYHAAVHATIKARLRGTEGDNENKASRGRVLQHTRKAMFNKMMVLNSSVKRNVYLQKYEPALGGHFPVEIFEDILSKLSVLLEYISLLSYATQVWAADNPNRSYYQNPSNITWLNDLSKLIRPINPTEEKITSILCQLSAAVSTGRSLPPRMELPKPYHLSGRLRELDPDILDIKHMRERGYSAYAVMEVISSMITHNLDDLVGSVESLVGVVRFDFEDLLEDN